MSKAHTNDNHATQTEKITDVKMKSIIAPAALSRLAIQGTS